MPYDTQIQINNNKTQETNKHTLEIKSKSTTDLELEAKRCGLKKQTAQANLLDKFNLVSSKPKFHSTQLEHLQDTQLQEDETLYSSTLDMYSKKISSTMINNNKASYLTANYSQINEEEEVISHNAFSNPTYSSPVLQRNKTFSSFVTTSDELTHCKLSFNKTEEFQSVNSSSYLHSLEKDLQIKQASSEVGQLYVCVVPYEAKVQGDLTLNYAERIKLIHTTNGMSLVQNISTKQCGYVPYFCITLLSAFLNQI